MTTLIRTSDPAPEEPLLLEEVKEHLNVTSDDDDTKIDNLITAARLYMEETLGITFMEQEFRLIYDHDELNTIRHRYWAPLPGSAIHLPRPPLVSIDEVSYVDPDGASQTWDDALYVADVNAFPGRLYPAYNECWPDMRCQQQALTIDFTAGHADPESIPRTWKQALLLLITHWYENPSMTTEADLKSTPMAFQSLAHSIVPPRIG